MKLATPMAEAASSISEASQQVTTDPQKAVEAWQALTDAYKSASSSISNAELKKTVDNLAKDAKAVTDQIKAVYVENDLSKLAEYTNAIQDMSSHQETLTNLCNANKEAATLKGVSFSAFIRMCMIEELTKKGQ